MFTIENFSERDLNIWFSRQSIPQSESGINQTAHAENVCPGVKWIH